VYLFATAIFDLPGTVILALAFVFAGLFMSTMRYAAYGRQWGILFARSPRIGFLIVFSLTILLLSSVVAAYTLVGHYVSTAQLAKASAAYSSGNLDTADAAAQNSLSFAPSATAYQIQAGVANARLAAIAASSTMSRNAALQAYQATLSSGINAALTATNLYPTNYQNWLALGNLYAQAVPLGVAGAYDSAKTAYLRAKELNPTNPQILYILAQLDIANKDTKAAQADLKAAIALKQDYTAAIFLLSQLEVQEGNVKGALASAIAAAYFAPNDPNVLFQVGILYAAQNDFANATAALSAAVTANPQFANARYFLAAVYARQGDLKSALAEMEAIAAMSSDNAAAVATQLASLKAGKNPFPANLLSITPAPVSN
jgi:tetratricopeptide (TPR) repeat protein